jgi:glutamine amidotransferase
MCVLSLAPAGTVQHRDDLETACLSNPDGFGYAIHTGRHILRRRSMVASTLIDRYLEDRRRFPDGPAMFHARIATSGKVDNSGCHPFFLGGTQKVAIGHNGILPIKTGTGWKSDTRILAEEVLPSHGGVDALRSAEYLASLENWMGDGNKLVILSADRRLPSFLILNEEAGHWFEGSWWSNYSYSWGGKWWASNKSYVPAGVNLGTQSDAVEEDLDLWRDIDCPACLFPLTEVAWEDGRCENCWFDLEGPWPGDLGTEEKPDCGCGTVEECDECAPWKAGQGMT